MDFKTLNLLFRCSKEFSHAKIRLQDMSDTECMICSFIYSNAGCSQEDVAAALKMDKTTVGKAIAALESKDCLQRTQDREDKRKKRLLLTEYGCEKISDLLNIHDDWLSEILKCLSEDEQLQFESYCKRMLVSAEALAEKHKREN